MIRDTSSKERNPMTYFFSAIYVAAIVSANLLVSYFGPWFSPINSFLLIGLDFSLRDRLHDRIGLWPVLGLVVLAGAVSYATNPASAGIAVASAVSFLIANTADTAVYQKMRGKAWALRSNASNTAGSAVDSLIFPWLAFGALMPHIVMAQFAAKLAGGFVWSLLLGKAK